MIQAGVINGTIETSFASNPTSIITHHDPYVSPGYGESGIDIDAKFPSTDLVMSIKNEYDEPYIPQQDGASDGFYIPQLDGDTDDKDTVTKPNTYDEETLNEDDDYEEDGMDDDKEIPHMIMCQFEHVKKRKNKWECKLKAGAMKINEKNILFSEAKGEFIF